MKGNNDKFMSLTSINGGKVMFGNNAKRKAIDKGEVGRLPNYFIDNILLGEDLKYNLLSIR